MQQQLEIQQAWLPVRTYCPLPLLLLLLLIAPAASSAKSGKKLPF